MNNLKAEMARHGVTEKNIQDLLNCSANTVRNKMSGATEFSFSECIKIRNVFFEGYRLEYLFAQDVDKSTKTA